MKSVLLFDSFKTQIEDIGTAIFEDESDDLLRYASSVISVKSVTPDGRLRFTIHKPQATVHPENERSFPCRLRFYNKQSQWYVEVFGQAWAPSGDLSYSTCARTEGGMQYDNVRVEEQWIEVQVEKAECIRHSADRKKISWWSQWLNLVSDWWPTREHSAGFAYYLQPGK